MRLGCTVAFPDDEQEGTMTSKDLYLDAMLRHLGAAYYDSLHGRADKADVTRAVAQVAGQIGENRIDSTPLAHRRSTRHHGSYHSRVSDIMTTSVVSVDRITPYKEIVALFAKHHIGGMPVLTLGRHVAGMVTDADLVAAARTTRRSAGGLARLRRGAQSHPALTAEQLMTAPAVTIHPDAPIATAARDMTEHHVRRLPVVDPDGKLLGIVSRRDLLRLFLRPDEEIARQVGELLEEALPEDPAAVTVSVHAGVVTLTSHAADARWQEELKLAAQLTADLDGVIDVVTRTASPTSA